MKRLSSTWMISCLLGSGLAIWFWNYYGTRRIAETVKPYNWLDPARNRALFDPKSQILYRGNSRLREIALTIDDGPHDIAGEALLDLLKTQKVKATFFVVGRRAEQRPDLIRRMAREGHEIGNHSQNHHRLDQLSLKDLKREILNCEQVVASITGKRMSLLRPPGMRYNGTVIQTARENGQIVVSWTCAARDYLDVSPGYIVDNILSKADNGMILLVHDERPATVTALARIIPALKREGYAFVTISQMLSHLPDPVRRNSRGQWEPID